MADEQAKQNTPQPLVDPAFVGIPVESGGTTGVAPAVASHPKSIFRIGEDKIFVIKKYLQLVWDVYCKANDGGRLLNITEMMDNIFSLFTTSQLRGGDIYWKEHACSNLRELTYKLSRENFSEALVCIDLTNQDVINDFNVFEEIRGDCLHNCAHFRTQACIDNARKYLKVQNDNTVTDDQVFDEIVTLYLLAIFSVFSRCKKT